MSTTTTSGGATVRSRETGWCCLYAKRTTDAILCSLADYPKVVAAWKHGLATFVDVKGVHGDDIHIRLDEVWAITTTTRESYAAWAADQRANMQNDAIDAF